MFEAIPPTDDQHAERTARQLAVLGRLTEIGMTIAEALGRQAVDAAPGDASPDLALKFAQVARAVRQTLALETRIVQDAAPGEALRRVAREQQDRRRRDQARARKDQVLEIVGEAIEIEAEATERPETVSPRMIALHERLNDRDDPIEDYADRPIGEMVARICKTLGVTVDWSMWETTDWAKHELRTRPEGSPFADGGHEPIWSDDGQEDEMPEDDTPDDPASPWSATPSGPMGPEGLGASGPGGVDTT